MIKGIGTDLCEVRRMADLLQDSSFLERYFTPLEQAYIRSRGKFAADSMAGHFAAKEALVKALGTGIDGVCLQDIVIDHDEQGAPFYSLKGSAKELANMKGATSLHLSITHDGGLAMAFAVLEGD
ncbi:MAG: holo-ACP synthase [Clostridiales bacterium]|nr:holo-ACP synthase [Clostridiales bacterium]